MIVSTANAIVKPNAVVVEICYTPVTKATMLRAELLPQLARYAPRKL
jgi:hypothetical protein